MVRVHKLARLEPCPVPAGRCLFSLPRGRNLHGGQGKE